MAKEYDKPIRFAVLEFTNACNLRCPHCASTSGKRRENELTTAEALARVLAGSLAPRLPGRLRLCSVTVCESPGCCAAYRPDAG